MSGRSLTNKDKLAPSLRIPDQKFRFSPGPRHLKKHTLKDDCGEERAFSDSDLNNVAII